MPKRANKSQKSSQKTNTQAVKIIAGDLRGRQLRFAAGTMVRPTLGRIRETLFNWLAMDMHGATVLDLFAGSGVLAIESISRGAQAAHCCEPDAALVQDLRRNTAILNIDAVLSVHAMRAEQWIAAYQRNSPQAMFDIVFLDPPFDIYGEREVDALCDQIKPLVKVGGLCYLEQPSIAHIGRLAQSDWQCYRHKVSGQIQYGLWERIA